MIEIHNPAYAAPRISLISRGDASFSPFFQRHEIIQGKVIRSLSPDSLILLINGKEVLAKTQMPLQEGQVLSLILEKEIPVPILRILGREPSRPDAMKVSAVLAGLRSEHWKSLFQEMDSLPSPGDRMMFEAWLKDLTGGLSREPKTEILRNLIDRSGFCWESKLRKWCLQKGRDVVSLDEVIGKDLKGLISRSLSPGREPNPIFERFFAFIHNTQLLNHLTVDQDRTIFFPFPVPFPDGSLTVGQLLIHLIGDEARGQTAKEDLHKSLVRITFLLDLSKLGPLRLDLVVKGREMEGRFLLSEKETKFLIERHLPILIDHLRAAGFNLNHLDCYLKSPDVIFRPLVQELIHKDGQGIDLVA